MAFYSHSNRAQLFIGRLDKEVRTKELEDIFSRYGKLLRCDIKYGRQTFGLGATFCYAFIDYEDRRDAEDAIRYENGRELHGQAICVEWAKGPNYRYDPRKDAERDGHHRSYRDDRDRGDRRRRRSRSDSRSRRRSRSGSPRYRRRRTRSRSGSAVRNGNGRSRTRSRSKSH